MARPYHRRVNLAFALRLALAPGLVGLATVAARRWGVAAGGWAAATPVVAGPVLLVYVSDHGPVFGSQAAGAATLGLISLAVFTSVYARTALLGASWPVCLAAGWAAFAVITAALSLVSVPTVLALAAAMVGFGVCRLALGGGATLPGQGRRLPADIPVRMLAALALVITLSLVAGFLGSRISGLIAPFPIIGSVMAVFTHVTCGPGALQPYTDALLKGLPSFALFTATVALTLQPLGTLVAFTLATLVAVVSHAVLITVNSRDPVARAARTQSG